MNDRPPIDPIPPQWLAAYVDGELPGDVRRQVEHWLDEHPEALAEVQDQESLAAGNDDYWKAVAPPLPSQGSWDGVFDRIANAATPVRLVVPAAASRRRSRYLVGFASLAGLAAAILVAILVIDRQRHSQQSGSPALVQEAPAEPSRSGPEDDGEERVYQVASADDVELIRLPEAAAKLVVVGRHPMADVPLLLASASDVQVFNFGPDDKGNFPDLESTLGPDASMLWAPPSKP